MRASAWAHLHGDEAEQYCTDAVLYYSQGAVAIADHANPASGNTVQRTDRFGKMVSACMADEGDRWHRPGSSITMHKLDMALGL